MMISSRHLSRQRLSPAAHLANVSILWPIWLPACHCLRQHQHTQRRNAAVGSQQHQTWIGTHSATVRVEVAVEAEASDAPRPAPPLPRPSSICKLRAGNVTCAAKTQFRCTDIDLPHKKDCAQTVAQVQIAFQRSARVTATAKGSERRTGRAQRVTMSNPHSWSSREVEVPPMYASMHEVGFGVCVNSQFADDGEFSYFFLLPAQASSFGFRK